MITNALTIDFEDWFCTNNLSHVIDKREWNKCEIRITKNTEIILELLNKYNVSATFFVLGWIADKLPDLILKISGNGHEIASHGYSHTSLEKMNKKELDIDIKKSLNIMTKIINKEIIGYRSPSFSITKNNLWAFDVLVENGFKYDSSVFPLTYHPDYGIRNSPTSVYYVRKNLLEIPISVYEFLGLKIPFSGGGYFRTYPFFISNILMKSFNNSKKPFVFYLHPWEIDENQPKVPLPFIKRFRQYFNIRRTLNKFEMVLKNYEFTTLVKLYNIK